MSDTITGVKTLPPITLPMFWTRNRNGKRYRLGDLIVREGGRVYVWMYEDNSNRCLHLPLESVCRNFKAL